MKVRILIVALLCLLHTAYAQSPNRVLMPKAMQADLSLLEGALTTMHPGLYRYQTPAQFASAVAKVRAQCTKPQTEHRFYILLAQLAEQIHCGHTYLNPLNLADTLAARFLPPTVLPFLFVVGDDNRFIITHNLTPDTCFAPGDELTSVNGIPTSRIIDSLLSISRSDGLNALGKKRHNLFQVPNNVDIYSPYDIFFPFFFGDSKDFLITLNPAKGKTRTTTVQGLTIKERAATYATKFGAAPTPEASFACQYPTPQTAYFKAGTFGFWNSKFPIEAYIDSVFKSIIANKAVQNLIIDIRENEGGNDDLANQILAYLATKPFGCQDAPRLCYRYLTLPDSLRPHLRTWSDDFYAPKAPALYTRNALGLYELKASETCVPIQPRAKHFSGKVYMLIGPNNSSATFEMAANFQAGAMGTLIGEPTGGTRQGLNGGKIFFLTLPNSHFQLDLPIQYYYHPGAPDTGVIPDVTVKTTRQSIAQGTDPALDYTLKLLQKKL
jgi:hypothetical protein